LCALEYSGLCVQSEPDVKLLNGVDLKNMIKPIKIFVYYLVLMSVFVGLSFLIPDEGVEIGKSSIRLKWFSIRQLIPDNKAVSDTSLLRAKNVKEDSLFVIGLDSIKPDSAKIQLVDSTSLVNQNLRLIYNDDFRTKLISFYKRISQCDSLNEVVRVLHFGDSQIEGDRITRFLRESFQQEFKGNGPGLIPVFDPQKLFPSIWIKNSGKWTEHTVYDYPRDIENDSYGLLGKVARIDSADHASVSLSRSFIALPKSKNYYRARLFVKNIDSLMLVKSFYDEDEIGTDTLTKRAGITEIKWSFETTPEKFLLEFETKNNPLFLGISLDSTCGVAVDNIAMRGQLSPRLDKTNMELFKSMANYLNIGMVILQYGTNMVPTVSDNYDFYRISFLEQLQILKEVMPDVPVVVVGVGDVAKVEGGKASSLPRVKKIINAQKEATLKAGFAFFDLYEAMGGDGSIVKWVEEEPHLAMSDYTHFNKFGGEKVANWLYNAIMQDYRTQKKDIIEIRNPKETLENLN